MARHRKVVWDGVEYESIKECSEAIGKSYTYIRQNHCDSEFYWRYIDFSKEHTIEEIAQHMYRSGMLKQKPRRDRIYRLLNSALEKIFGDATDIHDWLEKNTK